MRRSRLLLLSLFAFCAATMYAQPSSTYPRIMFVTYNGAPVYDSSSYISAVVAELRRGDSVHVLGVSGKYYRIMHGDREGFLLWSNVAAERPKEGSTVPGEGRKKEAKKERKERENLVGRKVGTTLRRTPSVGDGESLPADSSGAVSSAASEKPKSRKREMKGTQCRATTKSGGQCSRSTTDSSGYCWQHNR